ncbi:MAG TPA: manganese efflux pump MntP family protein [Anaerolineaceae bacterium]
MSFAASLFIAVGLAMDAFAVSLGIGTTGQARDRRSKFRLAFHFGFFQSMMTVLGWLAGSTIAGYINQFDHWIALALLGYVGVNMIRSGFDKDGETYASNPSKGRTLMMLCVATSLDAMAVGLSMAMLRSPVLYPSLVIGVVTSALSVVGLLAGCRLGETFGKRMEVLGGLVLLFIGIRVVLTHVI